MPPFAPWQWLFLSKEHPPAEGRWVFFFCNIDNREKQCGHSPVVFINGETKVLQLPRCRIGHSFLGGKKALCNTAIRAHCTWRGIRFYCLCHSLDSFSLELPIAQRLGFKGWYQEANANMRRIWVSVQYVRICNISQTRSKTIKTMPGLNRRTYFNLWNFGLRKNMGGLL